MKLDVLAIGAHPDDVELSCSGVLLVEKKNGKKVGIADLTQGELGTRGTAETRKQEATDAAAILSLDIRVNIGLRDGFFQNNEADQLEVIKIIRKFKPEIVLCNAPSDRHPDHGKGASLVRDACFLSGLRKIKTAFEGVDQEAWRPKYVLNYIQDRFLQPNFVIDISDVMQTKLEAIKAYGTQFNSTDNSEPQTYISTPNFLDSIIYRSKMMGKMIGVQFAEGFISEKMIGLKSLDSLIKENT